MAKRKKTVKGRSRFDGFVCRRSVLTVLAFTVALYAAFVGRYFVWPQVDSLEHENPSITAFMEYRKTEWARSGKKVVTRWRWRPLHEISPYLWKAVTVAEDSNFWDHDGFDWDGISNAINTNLAKGRFSAGGSTITQQLAKNLYLSPVKSLTRKAQEAILAWRLERGLSKERILELYLNVVEWGEGIYGAEAAARYHFGVSAANLAPRQAAILAAMLPAPLKRKPHNRHVQILSEVILRRMR